MSEQERKIETLVIARLAPANTASAPLMAVERAGIADVRGVAPDSPLSMILRRRALERLAIAAPRADAALRKLGKLGVKARLIGSMARGAFRSTSDVDFLVEDPGFLDEDAIEDIIRLEMDGFPFDVVYESKIPDQLREYVA